MRYRSIFLPPEPRPGKVLVELLDDLRLAFSQPGSALVLWHLQYRVTKILP